MSYIRAQDGKRRRITEDAQTDVGFEYATVTGNINAFPQADRIYWSTNIQGNATVVVGDNHGTLITHHHHQSASTKSKLSKLLLDSLSFEGMGTRLRNVNPALSRTCQWLHHHEHFLSWIDQDRTQSRDDFLWLKGKPGSGKSTIMRSTFLWAQKEYPPHTTLSYFFDARSPFPLAKSVLGLYRSVLYQLLFSCVNIRDLFVDRFSTKAAGEVVETWTEKEIQNFLIDLLDAGSLPTLMFFIDALDESHDDDIQELVASWEDLQQRATDSGVRLRVCFSSRHYPHISIRGNSITIEDQLGHKEDIDRYVRARLCGEGQTGIDEIRQKLLSKAAGVFLWVALMIPRLNQQFNRGEGLAAMLEELEHSSARIQDLFNDILARDQGEIDDCITLLRCVLCMKRPLSPEELYRAIRRDWYTTRLEMASFSLDAIPRYLLTCSRGLVECTPWPHTVQFIHETVRETLIDINLTREAGNLRSLSTPLIFEAEICHATMVEICLSYLLILGAMNPNSSNAKERRFPEVGLFMLYSTQFWSQHMQETTGALRQPLLKLASSLLTNHRVLVHWTHFYDTEMTISPPRTLEQRTGLAKCASPLYYAVLAGIPELVKEYINTVIEAPSKEENFDVTLGVAAQLGYREVVQVLLEAGAKIDGDHHCALIAAAENNHQQVAIMLLENGAQINQRTPQGTALSQAVSHGHEEMVRLLLEHGADVNADDSCLYSHMLYEDQDLIDMTRLLLEYGAGFKSGKIGHTLVQWVFTSSENWQMMKLLLERNADLNPESLDFCNEHLKEHGQWELMTMLKKVRDKSDGVSVNLSDFVGYDEGIQDGEGNLSLFEISTNGSMSDTKHNEDDENDEDNTDNRDDGNGKDDEDDRDKEDTGGPRVAIEPSQSTIMSIRNICG